MAKYKLLVNGYGLDGSAHTLTDEEVQTILSFKEKEGHKTLDEMYMDLPEILEDYDHYMTNYWVTTTTLANDSCHFVLVNFLILKKGYPVSHPLLISKTHPLLKHFFN